MEPPVLTPRGRIRSDSEGPSAGLTDNTRQTGTRNLRFNETDAGRVPRLAPEMDRPGLWPTTPNRRTVRALKAGGSVRGAKPAPVRVTPAKRKPEPPKPTAKKKSSARR